jgi:hypothetical protein
MLRMVFDRIVSGADPNEIRIKNTELCKPSNMIGILTTDENTDQATKSLVDRSLN